MSLLRHYLTDTTYHYRVKTVVELDDAAMDRIEKACAKYVPKDISAVMKTVFQRHPLDFPGIDNGEVYIVDLTFEYPASSYVLQQELRYALNIPEKFIIVRGDNDPSEIETQRLNAVADLEEEADAKGLERDALLNHPDYPEAEKIDAEDYYGDAYNSRLTDYLHRIKEERKLEVVAANAPKPFEWLEQEPKQDTSDFNAHIDGAPQAASTRNKAKKAEDTDTSNVGTVKDTAKNYRQVYGSSKSPTILTKTGAVAKKDK